MPAPTTLPYSELILEDVGCFAGRSRLTIKPITLLVGASNTGKSTILGCLHALANTHGACPNPNFNRPPFRMGTFADIASKSAPANKMFKLGVRHRRSATACFDRIFCLTEGKNQGRPVITRWQDMFSDGGEIHFSHSHAAQQRQDTDGDCYKITRKAANSFLVDILVRGLDTATVLRDCKKSNSRLAKNTTDRCDFAKFVQNRNYRYSYTSFVCSHWSRYNTENFVRLRTIPERSTHPMHPADNLADLAGKLAELEKPARLFEEIHVHRLGNQANPIGSSTASTLYAGYGPGQIVPLLSAILAARAGGHFLLQQPEMHLSPDAQAEIASVLVQMHSTINKHPCFIVETGSSHLINRIQSEIRKDNITADHVSLIYLNSTRGIVKARNMSFDRQGNIGDAPWKIGRH